jgi:hypothetical protein
MEQEKQKLHVYLMAMGLLKSNSHLTKKQLELLLATDSEKFSYMFFPTDPGLDESTNTRIEHIKDIFEAYRICYTHLLSLYDVC